MHALARMYPTTREHETAPLRGRTSMTTDDTLPYMPPWLSLGEHLSCGHVIQRTFAGGWSGSSREPWLLIVKYVDAREQRSPFGAVRRGRSLQPPLHTPRLHSCISMSEHHNPDPLLAGEATESPSTNDPDPSGRESPAGADSPGEIVSTLCIALSAGS